MKMPKRTTTAARIEAIAIVSALVNAQAYKPPAAMKIIFQKSLATNLQRVTLLSPNENWA
jgi:hypothetical protein